MYIFRLLFKIFWLIMFITGCSGSSGNNYVGGSGAPEVGTNLVVTASSYEVPVNTSVRLNAYTISGTNHAIDEVTSAVTFKHDKTGLFSSFSANDVTASDNTVKYSKAGTYTVYAHHGEYTSPEITIKVVDASFEKVVINSSYTTVPSGQTIRLTATGFFYERDILKAVDVTNDVDWISGNPKVLTATNVKGQYKANLAGNTAININWKNLTDKLDFSVNNEPISSLVLVTSRKSMVIGSEQRVSALAYYANGAAYDVSGQVSYNITPASAASVRVDAKDANVVWLTAKEAKPLTVTASFTDTKRKAIDSVNSVVIEVSDAVLTGLRIAPEKWTLGVGQNYIPSVVGIYNDGSNSDVTKQTSLTSSDTGIVTINNPSDGIHAEGVGSAIITAKLGDVKAANNLKVEVKDGQTSISQIKLLATSGSLPVGGIKQQYSAVAVYANGGTVDISNDPNIVWQIVGDNDVAQINARSGLLTTGNKAGDIRIQVDFAGKVDSVGLSVVDEKMVSLMISAAEVKLPLGNGLQYYAMAHYDSGKSQDVTSSVIWNSESPTVASIEPHSGKLTSLNPGSSNISASFNRADGVAVKSNILNLAVENKAVTRLVINAATSSLPTGGVTQQYKAFAYYDNGDVNDVTTSSDINWSVSGASAAAVIDNLNYKGLLTTSAFTAGIVKINVTLNNIAATPVNLTVVDKQPRQLIISTSESTLPVGINQQFKAYAVYDNFEQSDVTDQVSWSIDSSELATITPTGLVTTKSLGTVIVTASLPTTGLLANSTLNIVKRKQLSLVLSPSHAILPIGLTQRYHAIAFYDNGESADVSSSVSWNSSALAAATVDNGLATAIGSGNTIISASLNDQIVTGNLTINNATLKNVNVVPASLELALNTSYQLKAIGSYDNVTQQELSSCTWRSSSSAVTVDALSGAIRAQAIGNAIVTATCDDKEASSAISVVSASISSLQITPSTVTVAVGNTTNMYVVASYNNGNQQVLTGCTWTSDDAAIAAVANGTVTGVANGNTTVKANCGGWNSEISAAVRVQAAVIKMVQITPKTLVLPYKSQYQLRAIASYDNGTQGDITNNCEWSSNNTTVAGVDSNSGLVSAQIASGNAQISASCANGSFSSTANVTVQAATLASVTITPSSATMAINTQQKLEVVGNYVNLDQVLISEECAWSSSAPAIASVETTAAGSKGLVRGLTNGTADITATCPNAKSVKATITVRAAALQRVLISPESVSLPENTGYQLNAIGTYDNMTQHTLTNCTWSKLVNSTASNLAVRESDGQILTTGNIAGSARIGVTCNGKVANAQITVIAKSLKSIKVSPSTITIPTATSTSFEVIGTYNDGSSAVQASGCTWTTNDASVAGVNTLGKVSATSKSGSSTITATCGTFSSSGVVTVAPRSLQSLQVSPAAVSIPANTKYQLQAFGSYDDYSLEKIESCVWSRTSGTTTVSVESTTGNVSAGATTGSAIIQASCGGKSANSTVTVNAKALNAIAVTPGSKSLSAGESFALSIVGSYSDGSAGEVTSGCTWTSADTSTVAVSGSGVVSAVAAGGPVNIAASCNGKSSTAAITVNRANNVTPLINGSTVTSISVPVNIRMPVELSFKTESGNIRNFELLSPSLKGMPAGWKSESLELKCSNIAAGSNNCSVKLEYYPLDKTNRYKGTLNIVYSYTNNLGQIKYETKQVQYEPSNRFAFYTTGNQGLIGRCTMDDNDKYIQESSCTTLTVQDLAGNQLTHSSSTTGINFYDGRLYFTLYHAPQSRLYRCNIDTSTTIKCDTFFNNTLSGARGIFIDRFNILIANALSNNLSQFAMSNLNSDSNLSVSIGNQVNDVVVDRLNGKLFASVSVLGRVSVVSCDYNFLNGVISSCATIDVPNMAPVPGAYIWGIATYTESINISALAKSHLYAVNARVNTAVAGYNITHCDIASSGSVLNNCSNVSITGVYAGLTFKSVSKIDIVDGMAYILEHATTTGAIYQCSIESPTVWECNNVASAITNLSLRNVEMMSITGRSD